MPRISAILPTAVGIAAILLGQLIGGKIQEALDKMAEQIAAKEAKLQAELA